MDRIWVIPKTKVELHGHDPDIRREHEGSDIRRALPVEFPIVARRKEMVDCKHGAANYKSRIEKRGAFRFGDYEYDVRQMEDPKVQSEETRSKSFGRGGGIDVAIVYLEVLVGKFVKVEDPKKIADSNDDALHPVNQHLIDEAPLQKYAGSERNHVGETQEPGGPVCVDGRRFFFSPSRGDPFPDPIQVGLVLVVGNSAGRALPGRYPLFGSADVSALGTSRQCTHGVDISLLPSE